MRVEENFPGVTYVCVRSWCTKEVLITRSRRKPVTEQMQDKIDELTENYGRRKEDSKEALSD